MTVTKHKKNQVRAKKPAPKKPVQKKVSPAKATSVKKPVQKKVAHAKATSVKKSIQKEGSSRKVAVPLKKKSPVVVAPPQGQKKAPVPVARTTQAVVRKDVIPLATKPSALTCPLVLDGIVVAEDFSTRDCFSCDEFDCRFYSAEERSGPLGSRLFAGEEEGDEDLEDAELFGFERGEGDSDQWGDEDEK